MSYLPGAVSVHVARAVDKAETHFDEAHVDLPGLFIVSFHPAQAVSEASVGPVDRSYWRRVVRGGFVYGSGVGYEWLGVVGELLQC